MHAGLTAAVLFSAPVFADDAQQTTTTTMREAQHEHAADQATTQAHQHAERDGSAQSDSMHAAMANRAAMGAMGAGMMGRTSGACQGGSDCQNAAGMMRSTKPGMTGGSASGESNTGGMTPGSGMPGTATGGGSMGGKR